MDKIAYVRGGGGVRSTSSSGLDSSISHESRVRFLPSAGVIATLPKGDREIRVIPAKLPDLLKEQGGDYLHLISVPPHLAEVGTKFTYQLETLSNQSPVTFHLESGPEGMRVDDTGKVVWMPAAKPKDGTEAVVISARVESGKEAFQSFVVTVAEEAAGPVAAQPGTPEQTKSRHATAKQNERKAASANSIQGRSPAG